MSSLVLPKYPLTEKSAAMLGAMAVFASSLRVCDLLVHKFGAREAIGCVLAALVSYYLATCIEKSASLNQKSLSTFISVLGCRISTKEADISEAAWVRARNAGSYFTEIVIEVGTNGYKTTELFKLPYRSGKGSHEADDWCNRVALHLGVQSKGYKGKA